MHQPVITLQDIEDAENRLSGVAHRTPVLVSIALNRLFGAEIFFKCENFQRTGAFKFRGGYNALCLLSEEERARGVVAYSSGNHAQAVALSAKLLDMRAVIVMPSDAPAVKVNATREYGGEVVFYDRYHDNRDAVAEKIARERKLILVQPYDDPRVMAGHGTCALELFGKVGELDMLLTPVGGGGLLSGCSVAARAMSPGCAMYGVEPQNGNDAQQSLRSGKIVHISPPSTIADGAQTRHIGAYPFRVIRENVTDILTVSDDEIVSAMQFFAKRIKMVVEPTGCLAAAAVLSKKIDVAGKRVGIIVSGGNVDLDNFAFLLKTQVNQVL